MFLVLQQNKNVLSNVLTSFMLSTKKMNKQYDFKKCKGIISISFDLWKNIKPSLLFNLYNCITNDKTKCLDESFLSFPELYAVQKHFSGKLQNFASSFG